MQWPLDLRWTLRTTRMTSTYNNAEKSLITLSLCQQSWHMEVSKGSLEKIGNGRYKKIGSGSNGKIRNGNKEK